MLHINIDYETGFNKDSKKLWAAIIKEEEKVSEDRSEKISMQEARLNAPTTEELSGELLSKKKNIKDINDIEESLRVNKDIFIKHLNKYNIVSEQAEEMNQDQLKYRAVNISSIKKDGRVEFRRHFVSDKFEDDVNKIKGILEINTDK